MLRSLDDAHRRIAQGFIVLGAVCALSVLGYLLLGWSFSDAVYMVAITIFSVGYGEVQPVVGPVRWLTIGVIVLGCSSLIYILGGFFQLIAEGELNRLLGKRKMKKKIEELAGHVIVCGLGRIGRVMTADLKAAGATIVLVDNDAERTAAAVEQGFYALTGDAISDDVLLEAGVTRARALATVLPNDALNVFITLTARNLNPDLRIIARAEDPASDAKLIQAGADKVVLPSTLSGERAAQMILRPAMVDFFANQDLSGLEQELRGLGVEIEQFEVDAKSSLIGRTVGELESSGDGGFLVIAIRRIGGKLVRNPEKHFQFAEEDSVLFMGHAEDIPNLREAFAIASLRPAVRRPLTYRGATGK
ncbi:MAG: potassium channel protein [Polyangiales bacterium]|jgi:voltage-gated potassium channel